MSNTTVTIPATSFRRIPLLPKSDPADTKSESIRRYIAICNVNDLPTNLPKETNPRDVNTKTQVARAIKSSFLNNDNFHVLNRGIVISAKRVSHDDKTSEMTIDFGDQNADGAQKEIYGIVDGGHTYAIIKENRSELSEDKERYVSLEIFTGIEDSIVDFAEARNTSVAVDEKSLAELQNKFPYIKQVWEKQNYEKQIPLALRQNAEGLDVREVIALMTAFDVSTYSKEDTSKQPIICYSGKESCLKAYLKDYDEHYEGKTLEMSRYTKLAAILPDILMLTDYIKAKFGDLWNNGDASKKGRIGTKVDLREIKYHFLPKLSGMNYDLENERWTWLPILAAHRVLVEIPENGPARFIRDPFKFFDAHGNELVQTVRFYRDRERMSANDIGKGRSVWEMLMQKALIKAFITNKAA